MEKLFSIITVCRNAQDTIGRTLESVDSQTFADYEHLVVDGASSDKTLDIVKSHANSCRRVISEPDRGIYDAMNKGICNTTGQYLIFLNAGDKFHADNTLETIAKAIEANEMPGIVYGQTVIVDKDGNVLGPRHLEAPANLELAHFAKGMLVCHQAFVANRKICHGYDTRYRFSADYEWCIKCLQHSRVNVGLTDEILIDYLNEGVTTRNRFKSLRERFSIMCQYYGLMPTIVNHFYFVARALKRKIGK